MSRIFTILLLLFVAIDCSALMTTVEFPDDKCRIKLSTTWRRVPESEQAMRIPESAGKMLLSGERLAGDDSMYMTLAVLWPSNDGPVDTAMFIRGIADQSEGRISREAGACTLGGVRALCFSGKLANGNRARSLAAFANGRCYLLTLVSSRRDPHKVSDLNAILAGFSFAGAPSVSKLGHAVDTASMRVLRFESQRCAITIPSIWRRLPDMEIEEHGSGVLLAAGNVSEHDSMYVSLTWREAPDTVTARSPGVFDEIAKEMMVQSHLDITGDFGTLGGLDAVDMTGWLPMGVWIRNLVTYANHRMYTLTIGASKRRMTRGTEASAIISSFSFIGTPKLPASGK